MGMDISSNWDEFRSGINRWASGASEEFFARSLAKRARELGLASTETIELDTTNAERVGDAKIDPDRIHQLADELLADAADFDDD